MQTQFKLTKITKVEYTNEEKRVLDIEVCHPNHLYLASSKNGALGVSHNSAEISLSNLSDDRMRHAKSGQWWIENPQRSLANNSVAYTEKPEILSFIKEWTALYESKSGERGIFNRYAVQRKHKKQGRRKWEGVDFLVNPCAEINLRSAGLCNLSEVVIREDDSLVDLVEKVKTATIIGTFQSTLTNFRYLRSIWKKNAEEERLLGVSLTGIMDHPVMSGRAGHETLIQWLNTLRETAIETNKIWAERLGINPSVATTCVKPSGCTTLDTKLKTSLGTTISMKEIFGIVSISPESIENMGRGVWIDTAEYKRSLPLIMDEFNNTQTIEKLYINGIEEVFSIEFEDGNTYKFTGNHKLKTNNGFKRVDSLTVEDEVISF